ncbi:TPA: hypothetical protein VA417_000014 [Streptococcus agalactiae]|uniref:hypothetical protein n=1 Tax=Eubacterium callanderi TaxID=53442 RepID=UPI0013562D13|nr:hypothetical protein [Eubacterium callanderi]HEO5418728.1 hypothetical protein [Streptococcus agalactiae]
MKLKLTVSPSIAGGFIVVNPQKEIPVNYPLHEIPFISGKPKPHEFLKNPLEF